MHIILYIYSCTEIQVDGGGLDDLERVISTKDSLQNHLSLASHINHTGAQSSLWWRWWRWIFRGGIYITVAAAARTVYIYNNICVCVTSVRSAGEEIF